MSSQKMKKINNVLSAFNIVATIIFTVSFIYGHQNSLTTGELVAILVLGVYATMYHSTQIERSKHD